MTGAGCSGSISGAADIDPLGLVLETGSLLRGDTIRTAIAFGYGITPVARMDFHSCRVRRRISLEL